MDSHVCNDVHGYPNTHTFISSHPFHFEWLVSLQHRKITILKVGGSQANWLCPQCATELKRVRAILRDEILVSYLKAWLESGTNASLCCRKKLTMNIEIWVRLLSKTNHPSPLPRCWSLTHITLPIDANTLCNSRLKWLELWAVPSYPLARARARFARRTRICFRCNCSQPETLHISTMQDASGQDACAKVEIASIWNGWSSIELGSRIIMNQFHQCLQQDFVVRSHLKFWPQHALVTGNDWVHWKMCVIRPRFAVRL